GTAGGATAGASPGQGSATLASASLLAALDAATLARYREEERMMAPSVGVPGGSIPRIDEDGATMLVPPSVSLLGSPPEADIGPNAARGYPVHHDHSFENTVELIAYKYDPEAGADPPDAIRRDIIGGALNAHSERAELWMEHAEREGIDLFARPESVYQNNKKEGEFSVFLKGHSRMGAMAAVDHANATMSSKMARMPVMRPAVMRQLQKRYCEKQFSRARVDLHERRQEMRALKVIKEELTAHGRAEVERLRDELEDAEVEGESELNNMANAGAWTVLQERDRSSRASSARASSSARGAGSTSVSPAKPSGGGIAASAMMTASGATRHVALPRRADAIHRDAMGQEDPGDPTANAGFWGDDRFFGDNFEAKAMNWKTRYGDGGGNGEDGILDDEVEEIVIGDPGGEGALAPEQRHQSNTTRPSQQGSSKGVKPGTLVVFGGSPDSGRKKKRWVPPGEDGGTSSSDDAGTIRPRARHRKHDRSSGAPAKTFGPAGGGVTTQVGSSASKPSGGSSVERQRPQSAVVPRGPSELGFSARPTSASRRPRSLSARSRSPAGGGRNFPQNKQQPRPARPGRRQRGENNGTNREGGGEKEGHGGRSGGILGDSPSPGRGGPPEPYEVVMLPDTGPFRDILEEEEEGLVEEDDASIGQAEGYEEQENDPQITELEQAQENDARKPRTAASPSVTPTKNRSVVSGTTPKNSRSAATASGESGYSPQVRGDRYSGGPTVIATSGQLEQLREAPDLQALRPAVTRGQVAEREEVEDRRFGYTA
ncbi:unnamed protein product, partial [Amoebophrya sp. A25]